ncbi:MAG TPA: hypothetical protein VLA29_00155 [Acidimicrobiia bacterium]|nr:hypothetical protein [Acidimicrobiia bacterium]
MATGNSPEDVDGADVVPDVDDLLAENEALRARLGSRTRWRARMTAVLVILTAMSVVTTTVAVWLHETAFDTDQFMDTIEPALDDPALYALLSDYVSEQALETLDIEGRIAARLTSVDEYLSEVLLDALEVGERGQAILDRFDRPSLATLAAPIAQGIETRITDIVDSFITSPEFEERLTGLVERTHTATVALIRGDAAELPNVYTENGQVRLDLIPIITDALRRVLAEIREFFPDITLPDILSNRVDEAREQLAAAVGAQLPEDFGQVDLLSEQRLEEVQAGVQRLDRFVWLLALITIALAAATISMSPTRRRTIIHLGLGVAGGLIVAIVAIRRLQDAILEEIVSPNGVNTARVLLDEVVSSLRSWTLIVVLGSIAIAIAAYLAGRPAWIGRLTEEVSKASAPDAEGSRLGNWIADRHDVLRIAGIVGALVVLYVVGVSLVSGVMIAAGLGLYLWLIAEATRRAAPGLGGPDSDTPIAASTHEGGS